MNEIETILDNFWIIKERDKDEYYRIKDSLGNYKNFITEKLGYKLIVNPYVIKLEKIPGEPKSFSGIKEFDNIMEYTFLVILLMFLEDMEREEQFVLSKLTEYIMANYPGDEKVDWTIYSQRKCLIKTIKFATSIGIIKIDDGNEDDFIKDVSGEVLYENTGISRYFMRNFNIDIGGIENIYDFIESDYLDIDSESGILRRQRVYRKILMSPVYYASEGYDPDFEYIKNFRNIISSDFEKYFNMSFFVYKDCAFAVYDKGKNYNSVFPEEKTISDIALLMNGLLREKVEIGEIKLDMRERAFISKNTFESYVMELKKRYGYGWSKEYREMKEEIIARELLNYMMDCSFVDINEDGICLLPLVGRVNGSYPKDFNAKENIVQERKQKNE